MVAIYNFGLFVENQGLSAVIFIIGRVEQATNLLTNIKKCLLHYFPGPFSGKQLLFYYHTRNANVMECFNGCNLPFLVGVILNLYIPSL